MKIIKLESEYYGEYEDFIHSFKEGLFYYSIKFKSFLEELLGVESNYLLAIDQDNKIQAVLPIMEKKGKYGVILNSLPYYGSNGGILARTVESRDFLLAYYYGLIQDVSGATYVTNPLDQDPIELENDVIDTRIGQWTKLGYSDQYEEDIMQAYDSSARRNVRKAIKSGVTVEIDNSQVDFLYKTHYKNITSVNGKAKKKDFFDLIDRHFKEGEDYNIYVAKLDGERIGALLLFYYNETVEYYTPAIVEEYRNVQALPLVIYQAMIDANKKGFIWWNWGGTWKTQGGVYKFKKKFGAIDKEYRYYIKVNNHDIYSATKDELVTEYNDFYVIPFDRLKEG